MLTFSGFRSEPEAAAIHASTLSSLLSLRPSQNFCIVDAGGGTVDAATYKLIGQLSQLEIAELCARTGANCGSLFLDLRFEALVKRLSVPSSTSSPPRPSPPSYRALSRHRH